MRIRRRDEAVARPRGADDGGSGEAPVDLLPADPPKLESNEARSANPVAIFRRRRMQWRERRALRPAGGPSLARWIVLALLLTFLGGAVGFALAVVLGITSVLVPNPRTFLRLAVGAMVLVPVAILARGLPPAFFVSPNFAGNNMAAHYLAGAALVLLVAGILRDTRRGTREVAPGDGVGSTSPSVSLLPEAPPAAPSPSRGPWRARIALGERTRRAVRFALGFWPLVVTLAGVDVILRFAVGGGAGPDPVAARVGANLAAGAGFALPGPLGGLAPTALRAPMVPGLVALASASAAPAFFLRAVWALVGGGAVIATGVASRRMFGARAGIAAAAAVALLPSFWLEDVRIESAPLAQLFVALLLAALAGTSPAMAGYRRAAAAGAAGGLLALTRPEGFVIAGAMILAWLLSRRETQASPARRLRLGLVAVVAMAAVAGPWFARNAGQFNVPSPVTEAGRIAAGANAPSAYSGPFLGSYDPRAADVAQAAVSRTPVAEGTIDRRLRDRAVSYAAGHPVGLIEALGARSLRSFELWSPTNERDVHAARGLATTGWTVGWVGFLVLLALTLFGYGRLWSLRAGKAAILFAAPLAVLGIALLTYGEPLARTAVDPVLAVVAGAGLTGAVKRPGAGRERQRPPRLRRPRIRLPRLRLPRIRRRMKP